MIEESLVAFLIQKLGFKIYFTIDCYSLGVVIDLPHTFDLPFTTHGQRQSYIENLFDYGESLRQEIELHVDSDQDTSCIKSERITSCNPVTMKSHFFPSSV